LWVKLALWLPTCLVLGVAVAWLARIVEAYSAPLLLFSILVGLTLGAALWASMRLGRVGHRPTVFLGTLLAASVAVVGQHYLSYLAACRKPPDEPEVYQLARQMFDTPRDSLPEYLRWQTERGLSFGPYAVRGGAVWMVWLADGLLVTAAAVVVAMLALRRPFCNRCRSWFATTRRGPIDRETARRLAVLADAEIPRELSRSSYRLSSCAAGCGPTGFELSWEEASGRCGSVCAWLDTEARNRAVELLDEHIDHP
jgi:hypothetical protein